jgi:hypothetical protein
LVGLYQAVTFRVAGRKPKAISYPVLRVADNNVKGIRRVDFVSLATRSWLEEKGAHWRFWIYYMHACIIIIMMDYFVDLVHQTHASLSSSCWPATQVESKLKFLNSVLDKLKKTDDPSLVLGQSAAMAYAHCLRAQVHLDFNNDYSLAKQDIQQAMAITNTSTKTGSLLPTCAWTILADAEEKSGNAKAAMEAWRQLATVYPSYATKAAKEVKRLQLLG